MEQMLSIKEAAGYLKINSQTLRAMAAEGNVPAGKVGRAWRFHKEDLDNFLRQQYAKVNSNEPT